MQLCTLPWLGFVPDDVTAAPSAVVTRLAEQLRVDAGALAGYGEREQTRTDHLRLVLQYAGWRVPRSLEVKELDEFLLARAMEHDSPSLLFRLACEHLRASQVVRPGVVTLSERVAAARAKAERETYDRLAHLLTDARCSEVDGLLVTDAEIGMARLRWLNTGPVEASAAAVKTEVAKLLFLRGLDAHTLDLSVLPAERRRFLASVGRRSPAAKLARREPHRRYPIVLTVLAQSAVDVLDEVVQLFDQAVSARESRAKHKLAGQLAERAKRSKDKLAIAEQVLPVLADPAVADEQVGGLLRERIGMGRLRAVLAEPATSPLPRDHGHLAQLASSYGYLRTHLPGTGGDHLRRRACGSGAAGGGGRVAVAQRHRRPQRARRGPERVRAGPLARLSRRRSRRRRCHRVPALLGTVRPVVPARCAAFRRCVCARVAPLRRPGRLPHQPRCLGAEAR